MIKVEYDRYEEPDTGGEYLLFRCPVCEEYYEESIDLTGEPPFVYLCESCGAEFEVT